MHDKVWAEPASFSGAPSADYEGRRDCTSVKLIDNTVIIVTHDGERESRAKWGRADAFSVALMLARRGRLEI
jgi:hypothetical protein